MVLLLVTLSVFATAGAAIYMIYSLENGENK